MPKEKTTTAIATYGGPGNRTTTCRRPQCGYQTTPPSYQDARDRMSQHQQAKHLGP